MGSQSRATSPVTPPPTPIVRYHYQSPTFTFDSTTGLTTETPAVSAPQDRFEKVAKKHQARQTVLHGVHTPHPVCSVNITDADHGKTFAVREHGSFTISLRENPSTGYLWSVLPGSRALGEPTRKFVSDAHQPGMTGVGGVRSFTWTTEPMMGASEGTVISVELMRKRPWEEDRGDLFGVNIKFV